MNDHLTISTLQLFQMFPDAESARLYLESRRWRVAAEVGPASGRYVQGVDRVKRDLIAEGSALATQLQHWKQNPDGASPRVWAEAVENMRDAADLLCLLIEELAITRTLADEHRRMNRALHDRLERFQPAPGVLPDERRSS
jgi:hypothetical protein